jgi:two-component system, NarL family, response regulator LiaR
MVKTFLKANKTVIITAAALAVLLFVLRWLEFRFLILSNAMEIYIGAIAFIFTGLGIWLALKLTKPKTVIVEKEVFIPGTKEFVLNETALAESGLSRRELEVLELMSAGLSNQEIASRLFVSLNTIKTHSSKVFEKLDVKRRTQAIEKARQLQLIR